MQKQTAVEWAMSQIIKGHFIGFAEEFQAIYDKAKAMEKEQIEQAYIQGAEMAKGIFKEELKNVFVLHKNIDNENNK